jgi:dUTP pyrophosphatase
MLELEVIYEGDFPEKAHDDDAGFDLIARSKADTIADNSGQDFESTTLFVNKKAKFFCGFKMAMPTGWEADIRSRSGLACKSNVIVINQPGTIDAGYRNELSVVLYNLGPEPFDVVKGMKIAQMLFLPVPKVKPIKGKLPESQRGAKGYGSTG